MGVYLGDDFDFVGDDPDNPTGYWETKQIVDLNERLLRLFGIDWRSTSLIDDDQWNRVQVQTLCAETATWLRARFQRHPLWGFKDPRTIRLLPFWRAVFGRLGVDDQYVVVIRNPLSVAASLQKRLRMPPATSHLLSLAYVVPHLHEIAAKTFVVTDYDLFVAEPRAQLERIARALKIPLPETVNAEIDRFTADFLDPNLRHASFTPHDLDTAGDISPLIREAYLRLYQLATDQIPSDAPEFWAAWKSLRQAVDPLIARKPNPT